MIDAECVEVLVTVGITGDLSFETLLGHQSHVVHDFRLVARSASQEMFEVQFHKAIGTVGLEKMPSVGIGLGQGCDESLNSEIAIHEQSINRRQDIQLHHVTVAEDLAVSRCQDILSMACV